MQLRWSTKRERLAPDCLTPGYPKWANFETVNVDNKPMSENREREAGKTDAVLWITGDGSPFKRVRWSGCGKENRKYVRREAERRNPKSNAIEEKGIVFTVPITVGREILLDERT